MAEAWGGVRESVDEAESFVQRIWKVLSSSKQPLTIKAIGDRLKLPSTGPDASGHSRGELADQLSGLTRKGLHAGMKAKKVGNTYVAEDLDEAEANAALVDAIVTALRADRSGLPVEELALRIGWDADFGSLEQTLGELVRAGVVIHREAKYAVAEAASLGNLGEADDEDDTSLLIDTDQPTIGTSVAVGFAGNSGYIVTEAAGRTLTVVCEADGGDEGTFRWDGRGYIRRGEYLHRIPASSAKQFA